MRARIRRLNYSIRTEDTYVDWVRRFVLFHGKRHPRVMGAAEIEAFLTHLAVVGKVSASTQSQATSTLRFLYREVLGINLPWLTDVESARKGKRLPVVKPWSVSYYSPALFPLTKMPNVELRGAEPALSAERPSQAQG